MINYNILAKERKEKGITWGHLESCIGSGYRGKFVDFKKGKTSLTKDEEKSLAQVLGVSVDYLSGKEKQKNKLSPEEESLSDMDKEMLSLFKELGERDRKLALAQLRTMLSVHEDSAKK